MLTCRRFYRSLNSITTKRNLNINHPTFYLLNVLMIESSINRTFACQTNRFLVNEIPNTLVAFGSTLTRPIPKMFCIRLTRNFINISILSAMGEVPFSGSSTFLLMNKNTYFSGKLLISKNH